MKYLIIFLVAFSLIAVPKEEKEYISIVHIGASNKPIFPIIISTDSISDKVEIFDKKGKPNIYTNANNYIVSNELYNKLETLR